MRHTTNALNKRSLQNFFKCINKMLIKVYAPFPTDLGLDTLPLTNTPGFSPFPFLISPPNIFRDCFAVSLWPFPDDDDCEVSVDSFALLAPFSLLGGWCA